MTPGLMRTGGVKETTFVAGAAGAAAAAAAAFVEACPLANWQLAVKATASITARPAIRVCIKEFVFFMNFLWVQ
ncbi:MAG TPA: hypothetical protein VF480_05265 [Verrucomicrobiae bacterium]